VLSEKITTSKWGELRRGNVSGDPHARYGFEKNKNQSHVAYLRLFTPNTQRLGSVTNQGGKENKGANKHT